MGLYLDDRNNSSANGAIVQVWKRTGGPDQVWQVMSDGTIGPKGWGWTGKGTGKGTRGYSGQRKGGPTQGGGTQKGG